MKLHWSPRSPFVRKVMVAAHEIGLADRLTLVRSIVTMSTVNEELMRDNPLNKLPTLVLEDGQALYDSLVICAYLDTLHDGPKLIPRDASQWLCLRRHALANGLLDLVVLWRNELGRPPALQSAPHLAAFALKAAATLDRMESEAGELARAPFDLAQIGFGCAVGYLDFRFAALEWRARRPALTALAAAFEARPSARATGVEP